MKQGCRDIRRLLGAFHDGELDQGERRRVAEHVEWCADCQAWLAQMRSLDELVRERDAAPTLTKEYWELHRHRVWRRIRHTKRERREHSFYGQRFLWLRVAQVAAGAAVVVIAVVAGWRLFDRELLRQPAGRGAASGPAARAMSRPPAPPATPEPGAAPDGISVVGPTPPAASSGSAARPAATAGWPAEDRDTRVPVGEIAKKTDSSARPPSRVAEVEAGAGEPVETDGLVRIEEAVADLGHRDLAGGETRASETAEAPATAAMAAKRGVAVLAVDECDVPPELLTMPEPPRVEPGDTASVLLRALVERDGSVSVVLVEQSSGAGLLDTIAIGNARQARFRPGYSAGDEVRCWVEMQQVFRADSLSESLPAGDTILVEPGKPEGQ